MMQQKTISPEKAQSQNLARKHAISGFVKSLPWIGTLLNEMTFEIAKSEADAKDKQILHTALSSIQQTQAMADGDMETVILSLQQMNTLSQQMRDFLGMVAGYLQGHADTETSRLVETAAARAIEKHAAELTIVRADYLKFVIDHCGRLEPRGIPQTVRAVTLPLDKVYVSLMAEREQERDTELLLPPPFDSDMEAVPEERFRRGAARSRREITRQNMGLPQAVTGNPRIVMLGKPGAGKTTLTRFLAARFACALRDGHAKVTDNDGHEYGNARLPIRIRIADYADAFRKDHTLTLRAFLVRGCHHAQCPHEQLTTLFEDALRNGGAFLLLDGLDEVADAPTRAEIARRIEAFLSDLETGNCVLVTSRIAGYAEARLDDRFAALTLQDMRQEQIEQFLHRWCAAVERFHDIEAAEDEVTRRGNLESDALRIAIAASEGVRRLAVNPLLLTILALIHRQNTRLPEHRIELYKLATETLLRDWRVAQAGAEGRIISRAEEETLLWPLAQWMHEEYETGRIPEADAQRKLRELYAEPRGLKKNDPKVIDDVEDFLRRVTQHSGLFVPYPPDEYGFLHLTFEEYMTGRALVSDDETAADNLRKYRHRARWEEPLRLAISGQTGKTAANLIRKAIWSPEGERRHNNYQPSEYEDILRRDLLLAARCLGDCEAVEPLLAREIAGELAAICLNQQGKGKYEPLRQLAGATVGMLRHGEVGAEALRLLLAALNEEYSYVRSVAAEALGTVGQGSAEVVQALLAALNEEDSNLRYAAARALGTIGQGSAEVVQALLAALKEKDSFVRSAAAGALGTAGQGSAEVMQALLAALKEENSNLRYAAARALGTAGQGSAEALRLLLAALKEEDSNVRFAAAGALGTVGQGSAEVMQALLAALKEEDSSVRSAAARALGTAGQGSAEALRLLLTALKDKDSDVRSAAARALGTAGQGSAEALRLLLTALKDKDSDVRFAAAGALGTVGQGSAEVLSLLLAALKEEASFVRSAAARALGTAGQGSAEVVQALLAALKDKDSSVRVAAAGALGTVGQGSAEALRLLLAALNEEGLSMRNAAWESLNRLVQA